jgi:hypothetical protein
MTTGTTETKNRMVAWCRSPGASESRVVQGYFRKGLCNRAKLEDDRWNVLALYCPQIWEEEGAAWTLIDAQHVMRRGDD